MDFWKTILGLARRKTIGLPLLVAGMALAALTFLLVPTRHVSSTTMVLTTPTGGGTLSQDPSQPNGLTNPLLNFDEGLKTAATIIIHAMNTPGSMERLGVTGDGPTAITVDDGRTNPDLLGKDGPFIYIEGDSTDPDAARDVVVHAQELVRAELENRQKALGAPPITFIKMVDVVPPSMPEARLADKWQAAGMAFVLCVGLGMAGAYTAYRLRERRPRSGTEPTPTPDPDDVDLADVSLFEPRDPVTNGQPVNGAAGHTARLPG